MRFHHLAFACEAVPGAGGEAVVAAIDAIADGGAQFDRDGAFEFDGEIRDAEPGVELEWRGDGVGRAGGKATSAGPATVFSGGSPVQLQGGKDLGEKDPVPKLAADEIGVFADEAQARPLGQVTFEDRPGVDIPKRARGGAA